MYALKVEECFSNSLDEINSIGNAEFNINGISENLNDNYNSSTGPFDETDDQLADKITTLAGQINAATYRFLILIAEFDRRNAWAGSGIRSCAHWLSWKCSIDMGAAREKVRVARALEGLPGINAGFEKGELSFSKVRAMTRVATETNESFLLNIAEYGSAQHMDKLVQGFRTVSRIEKFDADTINEADLNISEKQRELNLQQRQQEARKVSCYQDDDGMWIIHAKLPAEEGGLVAKVLQELGDRIADSEESPDTASAIKGDIVNDEALQNSATSVAAETEMEIF